MESNPKYLIIHRLDYKNPTPTGGLRYLPSVNSFNQILDLNEISSIQFGMFYTKEEQIAAKAMFPKSYKPGNIHGYMNKENGDLDFNKEWYSVYFEFNTFWMDKTTGEINESAIARRDKIIKKIKSLLNA